MSSNWDTGFNKVLCSWTAIVARTWMDLRYILDVKEGEFVNEFPWDEG